MPSGSSRGRSGSSRGGSGGFRTGSSRGGFSSPTRSVGGYSAPRTNNTVIIAGGIGGGGYRRRGYSTGSRNTMGIFGVLCVISAIAALIGFMMMSSGKSTMRDVERDNLVYMEMIAKANPEVGGDAKRQRMALVIEVIQNDKGGKWWFTYDIIGDTLKSPTDIAKLTDGRALPVYTWEQVKGLEGTEIPVAISGTTLTSGTDSIPLSYAAHPITDDGDYIAAKSSKSTGNTLLILFGSLFVISLLANVGLFSFLKKRPIDAPSPESNTNTNATTKDTFCAYCGAKLSPGDTKCPNCGGIVQKS